MALPGLPINRYAHFIIMIVILDGPLCVHCNCSGCVDDTVENFFVRATTCLSRRVRSVDLLDLLQLLSHVSYGPFLLHHTVHDTLTVKHVPCPGIG